MYPTMRIKRLELQGFKSFKDKTVVHFDHSITGIVGPNGCGKSNIVDAFFWVMGEQSYKHIRGSGSDDLIFNGSSKFVASAVAEGTLVMEVPDVENAAEEGPAAGASSTADGALPKIKMKEIAVTRRLHRGGEGEYFINGVQSRLRDIQELFMDTGVGAKGYSIIEQGQIGKIVNAKPEDRRVLVEEAAGIAKYKARKKETERKLEAAKGNLSRLSDIIAELEKNLGSLERQADKARKYKEYKTDLLRVEMTWGRRKHAALKQRLEMELGQKKVLEADVEQLRAQFSQSENDGEMLRIAALDGAKQIEVLQDEVQRKSVELVQVESAQELARKRVADLSEQIKNLQAEHEQLDASAESDDSEIEKRRQAVAGSADVDSKLEAALAAIEAEVNTVRATLRSAEQAFESAQRRVFAHIESNATRNNERAALEARIGACEQEIQTARDHLKTSEDRSGEIGKEVARVEALITETKSKIEWLRGAIRDQEAQVAEHRDLWEQSEAELQAQNKVVNEAQGRLAGLLAVDSAFEGVSSGSKAVLDWANLSPASSAGARFLLDLFEVTPGYELALEGALEGRLQSVLFSDPALLGEAQAHIKSQGVGRVCLVAADLIEARDVSWSDVEEVLAATGAQKLGSLSDQVKVFAPGVVGVAACQEISRVYVVDQLPAPEHFGALTRILGSRVVVSLTGEVLEGTGTLRVGDPRFDGNHLILERKRQMRELEVEIEGLKRTLSEREVARDSARKLFEFSEQTGKKLEDQHREYEIQLQAFDREKRVHERLVNENKAEISASIRALQGREASLEQFRADLAQKAEDLTGFETEKRALEEKAEAARQTYEAAITHSQKEDERFQAERMQAVGQFEQTKSLSRELQSFEEMVRSRRNRKQQITDLRARLANDIERIEGDQGNTVQKIQTLHKEVGELGRRLSDHKNEQEAARKKISDCVEISRELRQRLDEKQTIVSDLAVRVEKAQGELMHLVQNLEEKYGIGCLEATNVVPDQTQMPAPVVTEEMSAEEELQLGEEVERLRERIRRLGEVNPMAAEEYDELKKRFDSMANERADLENSIKDLQAAIEHINKTSEDRFAKAFEAIADRFERLFPVVFGGGQAKLSLVYPEGSTDILDAGIDILAQPPGKKIVNIGLLSGGEKALTAVALIFGIFLVKPSPFCILDEVDAPLDDANIGRFNALLKEMSSRTQFIVVTHNKKTMELNDTLYGVTMEDPGVSKMVSIELH